MLCYVEHVKLLLKFRKIKLSPPFIKKNSMFRGMQIQMQCNAMQCNAMQCNAMQCNAMQCDAMRCDAMRCDAMRCDAMRCNSMQFNAMRHGKLRYDKIIYASGIVGKARWAHLSTSQPHQARAFRRGLDVAWCDECWDQPISPYPTMLYVFSRTNSYSKQQNQTEQWSVLERVRDGLISPYTSHNESQHHECEKRYDTTRYDMI